MDIAIRKIEEKDFPTLVALFEEFAGFERVPELMFNTLERMLEDKEYIDGFVAVTSDGEIVGYTTCGTLYYTWIGKSMYMDDLYVRAAHRGQGIGSKLINTVISYAKSSGCRKLRWQVSDWNHPAIAFYEQLGAEIDPVDSNCDLVLD